MQPSRLDMNVADWIIDACNESIMQNRITRIRNRQFEDMQETVACLDSLITEACMDASNVGARFLMHAKNYVDSQIEAYLREEK